MSLFRRKAQPSRADQQAAATAAAIRDLSERFERIERAIRDLKQNVDLVPSLVRKLYLEGVPLEPPYDLQAERFSFSSQNDEDGLVLAAGDTLVLSGLPEALSLAEGKLLGRD